MAREVAYTVVLVDANLQAPGVLSRLGLAERPGLSDYLTGFMPVEQLMIRPCYLEDLVVLPGGAPIENATEMLNSAKMERLVNDLKRSADKCMIVFDLPPVLGGDETLAFSPRLDAALLVIEESVTTRRDIGEAVELLSVTNILGTVMNKAGQDAWT
jgi:MinD-like ATPase involved in chromosome partitioning or flagellar assembly